MAEQLKTLAGKMVVFMYDGEERNVLVEQVKDCANGNKVVVGKDYNRNMNYRSFTLDKITNLSECQD